MSEAKPVHRIYKFPLGIGDLVTIEMQVGADSCTSGSEAQSCLAQKERGKMSAFLVVLFIAVIARILR